MKEEKSEIEKEWEEELKKEWEEYIKSDKDEIYRENGFASEEDFWNWKEG